MSVPAIFESADWAVRVIQHCGEPWFVATDIAKSLGYRDAPAMTRRIEAEDQGYTIVSTPGGDQRVTIINESGLYAAVFGSQLEDARRFQRWVTHDVLPAIRKTGSYGTAPQLPSKTELAQWVIDAEARAEIAEARVVELEPMAELATHLMDASGDYSVREAAQALSREYGIEIGQNRLFIKLREIRWIDARSHPYQSQIALGRLAVRLTTYDDPHTGEPKVKTQVRVTAKGVKALRDALVDTGLRLVGGAS